MTSINAEGRPTIASKLEMPPTNRWDKSIGLDIDDDNVGDFESSHGKIGKMGLIVNIVNTCIGIGIITVHKSIIKCGLGYGVILLTSYSILSTVANKLIVKVSIKMKKQSIGEILNSIKEKTCGVSLFGGHQLMIFNLLLLFGMFGCMVCFIKIFLIKFIQNISFF